MMGWVFNYAVGESDAMPLSKTCYIKMKKGFSFGTIKVIKPLGYSMQKVFIVMNKIYEPQQAGLKKF